MAIFSNLVKELTTGNTIVDGVLTTLLGTLIGGLILLPVMFLYNWIKPSTLLRDFDKKDVLDAQKHFIPNKIFVFDKNDKGLTPNSLAISDGVINEFIDHILEKGQKYYFLIAPTGIGKTTFLSNVFLSYKKKSRFSLMPPLILGHIHKDDTQKEIKNRLSKKGQKLLDLLKFKLTNPRRTILLLDGFDEFNEGIYLTQKEFWNALNNKWTQNRTHLNSYGKVIIAVREQFLQYSKLSMPGLKSNSINNQDIQYLKLQPFGITQINKYIQKRYNNSPNIKDIKATVAYLNRSELQTNGEHILSIPLILSYIEDLNVDVLINASKSKGDKVIDKYDIYSVIITKWLTRETKKSVTEVEVKKSLELCEELGFIMAERHINGNNAISEDDFLKIESAYFSKLGGQIDKSFITHLGDRSLLIKNNIGKDVSIRFAHHSFMEYFFASYALKVSAENIALHQRVDNILTNPSLNFTIEMLIAWGWESVKKNKAIKPEPHPIAPNTLLSSEINRPPFTSILKWLNFIERISQYESIKSRLKNDLPSMLNISDAHWKEEFAPLKDFTVDNSNFLNEGKIANESKELIRYVKTFVRHIELRQTKVTDEDLQCFTGAENIETLCLEYSDIFGKCFSYFERSNLSLEVLILSGNKLYDADLAIFEGFSNISALLLPDNNLKGKFMNFFKKSSEKIRSFSYEENGNVPNDLTIIDFFPNKNQWRTFGISKVNATVIIDYLSTYSIDSLNNLRLMDVGMTDGTLIRLSVFHKIKRLELVGNFLTGKTFDSLLPMKQSLETINLRNNDLASNSLKIFIDFPNLKLIDIRYCPSQDPSIIQALSDRGVQIAIDNDKPFYYVTE